MSTLQIRIPDELNETLTVVAKSLDRSKSYIAAKAIETYIREMLEDIEDGEEALRLMNNPDKKYFTLEEVNALLKIKLSTCSSQNS